MKNLVNLEKNVEKGLKYVKMSYDIMSTSKSCTARQIRLQKLESDHQEQEQQTNVKDHAQSSQSKSFVY